MVFAKASRLSTQAVRKPQSMKLPEKGPVVAVLQQPNAFNPSLVTHVLRRLEQVIGLPKKFQLVKPQQSELAILPTFPPMKPHVFELRFCRSKRTFGAVVGYGLGLGWYASCLLALVVRGPYQGKDIAMSPQSPSRLDAMRSRPRRPGSKVTARDHAVTWTHPAMVDVPSWNWHRGMI